MISSDQASRSAYLLGSYHTLVIVTGVALEASGAAREFSGLVASKISMGSELRADRKAAAAWGAVSA